MNDFETQFPSLIVNKDVVMWSRDAKTLLQEHCLDKQRVREVIDKLWKSLEAENAYEFNEYKEKMLKELGL